MNKKKYLLAISFILFFSSGLLAKPRNYWDHFREEKIIKPDWFVFINTKVIGIIGDYDEDLSDGPGMSVEVHRIKKRWRHGFEISYYPINIFASEENSNYKINNFDMLIFFYNPGYLFFKTKKFGATASLSIGMGPIMNDYTLNNNDYNKTYFSIYNGLALNLHYLLKSFVIKTGISYCFFFPIKSNMKVGQLYRANLSFGFKL